jgi:hypothetical protein
MATAAAADQVAPGAVQAAMRIHRRANAAKHVAAWADIADDVAESNVPDWWEDVQLPPSSGGLSSARPPRTCARYRGAPMRTGPSIRPVWCAVGIIVSELISNSIKHGFIIIQDPKIAIQLIQDAEGNIQLSYNDNGIGLKNLNTNNGETLGMRLIDIFSRQIKGNYTFDNNNGLLFKLNFKNESAV